MANENGMNLMVDLYKQAQRILIILFSLLVPLTGCSNTMSDNRTKFEWQATESAPTHYPMQIIKGNFWYHGDPGNGLYVPSGATVYTGWGTMRSSHNVGEALKPLPDRLTITYFSYAENKFFEGDFPLPYEKILESFQQNIKEDKPFSERSFQERDYDTVMVGVAPGGAVAVWVSGRGIKEVFFGQAKEINLDWEKTMELPSVDRKEIIKEELEDALKPTVLADIEKNGIPYNQWANFRTQYNWRPDFSVTHPPKEFGMEFYNGESGNYDFVSGQTFTTKTHPIPKEIDFQYAVNDKGTVYLYIIHFDEKEMLQAFSKLGANQQKMQLLFDLKIPRELTQIHLQNEKEVITLKKFHIEKW